MTNRRMLIPEGMWNAAADAACSVPMVGNSGSLERVKAGLNAALAWQSENPHTPDATQAIWDSVNDDMDTMDYIARLIEFQRRLFVEPDGPTAYQDGTLVFREGTDVVVGVYYKGRVITTNMASEPVEDYADKILRNFSPGYTPTHAELDKIWESVFQAGHGWTPPELRERGDPLNDLTVEVNRLGMSAATEVLRRTR